MRIEKQLAVQKTGIAVIQRRFRADGKIENKSVFILERKWQNVK